MRGGRWAGARRALPRVLAAAVDLVLPGRCAGCGGPGGAVCPACRDDVRRAATGSGVVTVGGVDDEPLRVWAGARFEGALRVLVTAAKDEGRHDVVPLLVGLLSGALTALVTGDPGVRAALRAGVTVLVVPVPTAVAARRRRGGDPVGELARRAVRGVRGPPSSGAARLRVAPVLRHARRVADQSRLSRAERRANLSGALAVRRRGRGVVAGATVVLVDDVVTTGATLLEAARALRAAGAVHVVAVTVAATPPRPGVSTRGSPLAL